MRKKIFIATDTMRIGGVERSLIGLLEAIDYSKYHVDLFIYNHEGELMDLIPARVNIIPQNLAYSGLLQPISKVLAKGLFGVLIAKILAKIHEKLKMLFEQTNEKSKPITYYHVYLYKYANLFLPKISNEQYDVSLAFLHPNYFEFSKITAKVYISWIHTDYSYLLVDQAVERKMWEKYDHIAAVSQDSLLAFEKIFPSLKNKLLVVENILSSSFVEQQANIGDVIKEMPKIPGELIFCTVGRFSFPKNMDNIPVIARYLKEMGLKFKWYLIGFGEEENKIKNAIISENVDKDVIVLGKRNNPYPYVKACDIYIQPSRFEGKAVTVREAQMLGRPVIITNYASSTSQVRDGFDGVIVPMENKLCAESIFKIVKDEELLSLLSKNTSITDYSNLAEIQKVYNLID